MNRAASSVARSSVLVSNPNSVSFRTRISTRSSNSGPNMIAGAGLRIVVAPAARARLKERSDGGQRDLELADRDIAFGQHGRGDILWRHQRIGAGHDDDGVVGIGDGDDGRSGMGPGGVLDEGEVDALRGRETSSTAARTHPRRAGRSALSVRRASRRPPPGSRPCRRENNARLCRRRSRRPSDAGRRSPPHPC